jgi:hypothetical protein
LEAEHESGTATSVLVRQSMSVDKNTKAEQALGAAARRLLHPVVRILLRYGISYKTFSDIAKRVFIDVASDDFALPAKKNTVSRVSVITGLTRRDVARLMADAGPDDSKTREHHNRIRRLVAGWTNDKSYGDENGEALRLPIEGSETSFTTLVRTYGNDVPVRAALDELLRLGVVERTEDDHICLVTHAYIPAKGEIEKIEMLGSDVADLAAAIDHNLTSPPEKATFQRKVQYDDLPQEVIDKLRKSANQKGQRVLEQMDRLMRQHDRGITGDETKGTGRKRLVLGVYIREEDMPDE